MNTDIADFDPVYNGAGDWDLMCFTDGELTAMGIPEAQWWTLLSIDDHHPECPIERIDPDLEDEAYEAAYDAVADQCNCPGLIWGSGYHYVNRANGSRSYIFTRQVPPDDFYDVEAYVHEA